MGFKQVYPDANEEPGLHEWEQFGLRLPNGRTIWAESNDARVAIDGVNAQIYLNSHLPPANSYVTQLDASRPGDFARMNEMYASWLRQQGIEPNEDMIVQVVKRKLYFITTKTETITTL